MEEKTFMSAKSRTTWAMAKPVTSVSVRPFLRPRVCG